MNADAAVEAVRANALELLRHEAKYAVAVDSTTYKHGARPAVLVAIARHDASVVLAIDASEYTPDELAWFVADSLGG